MAESSAEVVSLADFGAARQNVWRMGYRSDEVELFQRRLISHGFRRLQPTGMIDLTTAGAVRVLQKHLGIQPADGVVTPETLAALDRDEVEGDGAVRARAAGIEFSTPVSGGSGLADMGDVAPAGQYLAPTAEAPQTIQTIENASEPVPFYKNPMVWIGVGGAILVIYFLTRREEGAFGGDVDIGLEGADDGADDPEEFFAPRRRAPSRKPATRKPRKPRAKKKKAPPVEAGGVDGVSAAPKPKRQRRAKKGLADTALGPDGENTPDPHADAADPDLDLPDEEDGVAGPPKPRRRKGKAAGKRNAKGQFVQRK